MSKTTATARAPASVGNVAVGFDILGHALTEPADRVTVVAADKPGVTITGIHGDIAGIDSIARDAQANTAGRALLALLEQVQPGFGFGIEIEKGIPLLAGMGGSGASAVAAVVAANELLEAPLEQSELMALAAAGESAASGEPHADDVAASLVGGLVLVVDGEIISLPVPNGLHCALVKPHHQVATREARQLLRSPFELPAIVSQGGRLASFVSACYEKDMDRLGRILTDVLIEPRRKVLVPGFDDVQRAALESGALGCSLSGAGASMFAWCRSEGEAVACAEAMQGAFSRHGLKSDQWISAVDSPGASVC